MLGLDGLLDEHHGDRVVDDVEDLAVLAHQAFLDGLADSVAAAVAQLSRTDALVEPGEDLLAGSSDISYWPQREQAQEIYQNVYSLGQTPVAEGMKVFTRSEIATGGQKAVMEFLLINHPLDCPICDQGGECELQDVAMGYGQDVSEYVEGKRVVFDKNIGPLIATELTRCIHCTRCVRFGREIAGIRELGMTGRGENALISTFLEQSVDSEMSGNVIDICPVGALTAKPSRFAARAWELVQHASVAPHDCIGSNVFVHTLRGEVVRVVPRDNEAINEVWISDRDRFS